MKNFIYLVIFIVALASCDTPNNVIGNPEGATNTSGTTGSANMTNSNNGNPAIKSTPGTPTDTAVTKKDSIPRL